MKEILLFTLTTALDDAVLNLGKLGVVDIKEVQAPNVDMIAEKTQALRRTQKAISTIKAFNGKKKKQGINRKKYAYKDPKRLTDRILKARELRGVIRDRLLKLEGQRSWYETWGKTLNYRDFDFLAEKGIFVRLYKAEKSVVKELSGDHTIEVFPTRSGNVPFALFTRDRQLKLPLAEEEVPHLSYAEVNREIDKKVRQLKEIEYYFNDQAENLSALEEYSVLLQERLGSTRVLEGMGSIEGSISYLKGYIPRSEVDTFKSAAHENNWGYSIKDPEHPDEVPVYIKNPKWIQIINPVMKFIDIVPGYREVDVSIFFLIAFAVFFAMLVGDAGYGLIFLVLTFLVRKKLSPQIRLLIYVLSLTTMAWGVMSGTYFGSEYIAGLPFFSNLIIDEVASFGVDNISFMMHLSFMIGAIHLTLAHGIQVFRMINSIRALSEIGWILLVWGLFFVVEQLVLAKPSPPWTNWLFIAGALFVMLFSRESKGLIKSMLVSLANLPLSLINGFSDIVSYVRLFAVGMATAAVAASFNNMILPSGVELTFLEMIMAAIALLLGHGLNIALALMAVMVHGIRLNMLEFAGHLGVNFSGEAYQPFKLELLPERILNNRTTK